jgi:steroid 5-alpha reductase family enzyme
LPLVLAIFLAAQAPVAAFRLQDYLGAAILFAGIVGEAIADATLVRFRQNPANRGKVCDAGLWRWSRHPNYFFQWLGWLAYPVIAIAPGYPLGLAALLAPLFMFYILNYVTGVPPLERQMARSRGEAWCTYSARTSRFFPLPPKA